MALVFRRLQRAEIPDASVITCIATQVGGSFRTAVLAVILGSTVRNAVTPTDTAQAVQHSFWWATGLSVVAALLALRLPQAETIDQPQHLSKAR